MSLPSWARELSTLMPASPHFVLSGSVHDLYLVDAPIVGEVDDPGILVFAELVAVVAGVLRGRGVCPLLVCSPALECSVLPDDDDHRSLAEQALGAPIESFDTTTLTGLAAVIARLATTDAAIGLLVTGASRLVRDTRNLSDEEFEFFRSVEHSSRIAAPAGDAMLYNPVLWVVEHGADLPSWYTSHNTSVRSIVIPAPNTGERATAAERLLMKLGPSVGADSVRELTAHSSGLTLVEMGKAVSIALDQGLDATHIEDAVRSYRVGVVDNPWRRPYVAERLRAQLGNDTSVERLSSRVIGQDHAVRRTLDILVRSVTGLTGAHAAASATRPRGVLFFAGPTGVGKTELAKALTKLLFDDEHAYTRFDMSEFSAEHAADRLIGSPPGYVGHAAGGELTNAMRQRPFSVVLFDEIEKAHPRILDKFLQVLDDGRLTDGRGDTVYFTEAVIVFTSNLGIYVDREVVLDDGSRAMRRELNAKPGTPHEQLSTQIGAAIKDYFTRELGRPELLNRIGDNIIVFDFISEDVGLRILDQMLDRVVARVMQEYRVALEFAGEVRSTIAANCVNEATLELGGRGIGSKLETVLVNPLANRLFIDQPEPGATVTATDLSLTDVGWELLLRCE